MEPGLLKRYPGKEVKLGAVQKTTSSPQLYVIILDNKKICAVLGTDFSTCLLAFRVKVKKLYFFIVPFLV